MQGSVWTDLLRRIPAQLHDSLALGLVTGEEVVVQQLIRMEDDFLVVRGRMAGTTAEGRVMIVPFSHMSAIAFNKPMMEPEVQAIFGKAASAPPPSIVTPLPAEGAPAAPAALEKLPSLPASSSPIPALNGQPKPQPPSKSVLLARLRQRLAQKSK
jgi:hypothetical protein